MKNYEFHRIGTRVRVRYRLLTNRFYQWNKLTLKVFGFTFMQLLVRFSELHFWYLQFPNVTIYGLFDERKEEKQAGIVMENRLENWGNFSERNVGMYQTTVLNIGDHLFYVNIFPTAVSRIVHACNPMFFYAGRCTCIFIWTDVRVFIYKRLATGRIERYEKIWRYSGKFVWRIIANARFLSHGCEFLNISYVNTTYHTNFIVFLYVVPQTM